MIDTERTELLALIDEVFKSFLGGRATKAEVVNALGDLPPHLKDYCYRQGLKSVISQYFRTAGSDGLPQAPEVDGAGTHAQMELLTVDECRYLAASYRARGDANYERADRVVAFCLARYGIDIDFIASESA